MDQRWEYTGCMWNEDGKWETTPDLRNSFQFSIIKTVLIMLTIYIRLTSFTRCRKPDRWENVFDTLIRSGWFIIKVEKGSSLHSVASKDSLYFKENSCCFWNGGRLFFCTIFSIYVNENSNDKHCCIYDNHKFFISSHLIEPPPFGDGNHPANKRPNKIISEKNSDIKKKLI